MALPTGWLFNLAAVVAAAANLCGPCCATGSTGSPAPAQPANPRYVCPADPDGPAFDTPGFCGHDERIRQGSGLRVAVLVFEGAQLIDFTGPMEIFGQAGATVFTVAPTKAVRRSATGLKVSPDYDFDDAPSADVLLVPGGNVDEVILNPANKAWLVERAKASRMVLAVCTGTFLLGYAGLLDGLEATTFAPQIKYLKREFPNITRAVRNRRVVDTGKIITTAGLSAGIDGALHVVERWYGHFDARDLARGIEYDWHPGRQTAFGELAIHRMPHWPATVPAGSAWERYDEQGDAKVWETRAHVGFDTTVDAYLDRISAAVGQQGWQLTKRRPSHRQFQRVDDGQAWTLGVTLLTDRAHQRRDLAVKISRAGR